MTKRKVKSGAYEDSGLTAKALLKTIDFRVPANVEVWWLNHYTLALANAEYRTLPNALSVICLRDELKDLPNRVRADITAKGIEIYVWPIIFGLGIGAREIKRDIEDQAWDPGWEARQW